MADGDFALPPPMVGGSFELTLPTFKIPDAGSVKLHLNNTNTATQLPNVLPELHLTQGVTAPPLVWHPAEITIPFGVERLRARPDGPPGPRAYAGTTLADTPATGADDKSVDSGSPGKLPLPSFIKKSPGASRLPA
jgi:hypothetical protein